MMDKILAQKFSFPAPHQGILEQPFTSILATSCITQLLLSSRAHPLKVQALERPLENASWSPARLGEMFLGKWTKNEQDPPCLQMPRKHVHRRHTEPSHLLAMGTVYQKAPGFHFLSAFFQMPSKD